MTKKGAHREESSSPAPPAPSGSARPQLVARGHEVIGTTRTPAKQDLSAASGRGRSSPTRSTPTRSPRAVAQAEPDVIVHQLTALSGAVDLRHLDRVFALTNRLRTEGTDHLLAAGRAVGVRRFVAQSYAGWPFARTGGPVKTEEDPLDPQPAGGPARDARGDPPRRARGDRDRLGRRRRAALRRLLRARHQPQQRPATARWPSRSASASSRWSATAAGVWSFIHIDDAAAATVAAVEHGAAGIYNVVDDEPAPGARVAAGAGRARSAPSRRGACRAGSAGSPPARRRPS